MRGMEERNLMETVTQVSSAEVVQILPDQETSEHYL